MRTNPPSFFFGVFMKEARMAPEDLEEIQREMSPEDREGVKRVLEKLKAIDIEFERSERLIHSHQIFTNLANLSSENHPR